MNKIEFAKKLFKEMNPGLDEEYHLDLIFDELIKVLRFGEIIASENAVDEIMKITADAVTGEPRGISYDETRKKVENVLGPGDQLELDDRPKTN